MDRNERDRDDVLKISFSGPENRLFVHNNSRSDRIQIWDMRLRFLAGRPTLRYSCSVTEGLGSPSNVTHKLRKFSTLRPVFYLTL